MLWLIGVTGLSALGARWSMKALDEIDYLKKELDYYKDLTEGRN